MDRGFWRGPAISCDVIKHFILKGGHNSRRIEALSCTFIGVFDLIKEGADVHKYGPHDRVAMVLRILACMHEKFYTVLPSLEQALGFLD